MSFKMPDTYLKLDIKNYFVEQDVSLTIKEPR